jgi:hypothetical protein
MTPFQWSPEAFLETLPIMAYGMLGVFAVTLVLYFAIALLLKIFSGKEDNKVNNNRS